MAKVDVWCGPPRSERSLHIDQRLFDSLGHAHLLVPSRQYAAKRLERFMKRFKLDGVWGQPIITFQEYVSLLLRNSEYEQERLEPFHQQVLLRGVIDRVASMASMTNVRDAIQTEGFLRHCQRIIGQLKQGAVDPDNFRSIVAQRSPAHSFDAPMTEIYAAYQEALRNEGVYDLQGMYWMAHEVCLLGKPAHAGSMNTLLLDDFDDFTPSEFRLLKSLEPHLGTMVFGMNCDLAPSRADAYALPVRTTLAVANAFGTTVQSMPTPDPTRHTEYVSDHLFWRDTPPQPEGLNKNIHLHESHSSVEEIEELARSVKQRVLDEQISCNEIAITFRSLEGLAPTLRTVFASFGIPLRIHCSEALSEAPLARFCMHLYTALAEWRREAVLDIVTSSYFSDEHASSDHFTVIAERAGIISGVKEWVSRLSRLNRRLADEDGDESSRLHQLCPLESRTNLLDRIERLKSIDDALPRSASLGDHAGALMSTIESLYGDGEFASSLGERATLLEALRTISKGDSRGTQSRASFVHLLSEAFASIPLESAMPSYGVDCFDLAGIRHLQYRHVYVAALVEGTVPTPPSRNAIYSDADLETLRGNGLDLSAMREHTDRELLLFQRVFDTASESLTLSRHLVAGDGKVAGMSPFYQDVIDLLPSLATEEDMGDEHAYCPTVSQASSLNDLALLVGAKRLDPDTPNHAEFVQLTSGIAAEEERHTTAPFGPYDAHIREASLRQLLEERFDVEHTFSASQLETYISCPFRFYLERVLKLDMTEAPTETFDPRIRGSILHLALERFHQAHVGVSVSSMDPTDAAATMDAALEEAFEAEAWRDPCVSDSGRLVEKELLLSLLKRYIRIARDEEATDWAPTHFEVSFGLTDDVAEDSLSVRNALVLDTGEGPVRFGGRIDRVDLADGKARVIDYKTTIPVQPKDIAAGRSIQLALYAFALKNLLLTDRECAETQFLQIGKKKTLQGMKGRKKDDSWEARARIATDAIERAVSGIRSGDFNPIARDKSCSYCPNEKVCRFEQSRLERKAAFDE